MLPFVQETKVTGNIHCKKDKSETNETGYLQEMDGNRVKSIGNQWLFSEYILLCSFDFWYQANVFSPPPPHLNQQGCRRNSPKTDYKWKSVT